MKKAVLFKWVFQFNFTHKHYFGLYEKLFKPKNLFKGQSAICRYDQTLKMKVDLDEWIQQQVYFFGVYDRENINFIKSQIKPGDYFFDIGANVGCFSLTASTCVGDTGKVYAFEPVPKVFNRLNENIGLNGIKNISSIPKALFDKDTILKFYLASQENMGMSSIQEHDNMSGEVVELGAISLDSFIESNNITRVDFIKMDIEGAELKALQGMINTIRKHRPTFMVEISEDVLKEEVDRNQVLQFFDELKYHEFVIAEDGKLELPNKEMTGKYTNYIFKPSIN